MTVVEPEVRQQLDGAVGLAGALVQAVSTYERLVERLVQA